MQIQDEAMKAAVVKAVIDSMGPELIQKMVSESIHSFLSKKDRARIGAKTPLEEAFESAVWQVARETVRETIETDEMRAKVKTAIAEATERAFESEARNNLIDNMAASIGDAFRAKY